MTVVSASINFFRANHALDIYGQVENGKVERLNYSKCPQLASSPRNRLLCGQTKAFQLRNVAVFTRSNGRAGERASETTLITEGVKHSAAKQISVAIPGRMLDAIPRQSSVSRIRGQNEKEQRKPQPRAIRLAGSFFSPPRLRSPSLCSFACQYYCSASCFVEAKVYIGVTVSVNKTKKEQYAVFLVGGKMKEQQHG